MEQNTHFKIGDVVCLKSGGEPFTVHAMTDQGVEVIWMDGKKLRNATFHPAQLVLSDKFNKVEFVIIGADKPSTA